MKLPHVAAPLALALVAAVAGCTTLQVETDFDPEASFDGLRTYAWAPVAPIESNTAFYESGLVDRRIRSAVDEELAERGYLREDEGAPDFWVTYHAVIESKVDVTTVYENDPYERFSRSWGRYTETYAYAYDQGTLIVDIVDPKSEKRIWRGSAQGIVDDGEVAPEERARRNREAVAKILSGFPPET